MTDFSPILDENTEDNMDKTTREVQVVTGDVVTEREDVASITNLLNITVSHIIDDKNVRDKVNEVTESLDNDVPMMCIREKIDYLNALIKQRKFHTDNIFKAFTYVQRSEFAKELSVGTDRKIRVEKVGDRQRINSLMSFFNTNNENRDNKE